MTDSRLLLVIDAGGSHTRAAVVDPAARCLGYGESASGNATAVGEQAALRAIDSAARVALEQAGRSAGAVTRLVLAAAGARGRLTDELITGTVGLDADVALQRTGDVLAMYHSASVAQEGMVLLAGTGAVAGRFSALEAERVVDGTGWLLGDSGSGFWIGRRVARAAVADLDGTGPATALTDLLLGEVGIPRDAALEHGRPRVVDALVHRLYADRPVALARFAPLAFRVEADDPVAARIVAEAEDALVRLLRVVRDGYAGLPVVVGGSVLVAGMLAPARSAGGALAAELAGADLRYARDGVVGAAVVGLLTDRIEVTEADRQRLAAAVADRQSVLRAG